ncbi:hypothetical protein Tco_0163368 [Tanacetum coccineum]
MKNTEHYRIYAEVFRLDVPLTESQPMSLLKERIGHLAPLVLLRHQIREEQEARENVELVKEHLASIKIEKMVEGSENVIDDSLLYRNDEPKIPGTRLEPRSDKESPEVDITKDKEVEITNDEEVEVTNVAIPVNDYRDVKSICLTSESKVQDQVPVYVAKGLILERLKTKEEMEWMIAKAILQERGNIQAEISLQIHKAIDNHIPSQVDASVKVIFDPQLQQQDIAIWLALQMKFESPQVNENEQGLSTSENLEQEDDYDFWTESYASDDDEIPTKQMSQDIMEEVSLTIDEAKLKKMVDEMLRQRCTSGDEHQYHIDQMKNFLKSDIVWESRKEILVSPHPRKTTPLVQSYQRDPEAPPLSTYKTRPFVSEKGSQGLRK